MSLQDKAKLLYSLYGTMDTTPNVWTFIGCVTHGAKAERYAVHCAHSAKGIVGFSFTFVGKDN
jgi:hypothetical protein